MQVFTGLRRFLQGQFGLCFIYHMNSSQRVRFFAVCIGRTNANIITAVAAEVILLESNVESTNRAAVMSLGILGIGQMVIQRCVILVVGYQLQSTGICNVFKPCPIIIGGVVEHNRYGAIAVCIHNRFRRVARMRIYSGSGAKGGFAGQNTCIACIVVIRQIVIPDCQRTMLDKIVRQVMVTGVNCTVHLGAEVSSLSLISAGQGDRTRLCHERELDNRAVIGYRSSIFCYISTINGDDGIFLGEAGAEGKRQICACIGRYDLRICDFGLDSRIAAARRTAGRRTTRRGTAAR